MRVRRKHKQAESTATGSVIGTDRPAETDHKVDLRLGGKIDRVFIGESRQRLVHKVARHKRVLVVLLVILLAVGGGSYVTWYVKRQNTEKQQEKDYQALMQSVKDLRNQAKDADAQIQLNGFNRKYPNQTQEQRFRIASELSAIYKSTGDYKTALDWQQKAFDNNPNPAFSDYYALGEAYTMNDNKQEAIKYLQLALDSLQKQTADDQERGDGPRSTFIKYQIELLKGNKPSETP